jgi:hypothetical protein
MPIRPDPDSQHSPKVKLRVLLVWLQRELWNGDDVFVHAHPQVLRGAHRHLLSHLG